MRVVIVDDEFNNIEVLESLIKLYLEDIKVVGVASSALEAVSVIQATKPSLVFLDVELASDTGFDVLEAIQEKNFEVIFITAYNEYAIKAFQFSAIGYILKPIDPDLLVDAVAKARDKLSKTCKFDRYEALFSNINNGISDRLAIPTATTIEFFNPNEIIRVEANGRYSTIYLSNSSHFLATKNIGELDKLLVSLPFFRTHKSHLININHVKRYLSKEGSVEMLNGDKVPLSSRNKIDFLKNIAE